MRLWSRSARCSTRTGVGRPSLAPGRYFRLLLLGYFEGLDSDGRTHLAHTAEHAVDLDTGAIVGVTVQDASAGDTTTLVDTLVTAAEQVEAVGAPGIAEIVADKGYHSNETMVGFAAIGVRSYVSEPDRGRRNWKGQAAARDAVYANRRRIRGARGKRLRQRGELLERPNAHLYETSRTARSRTSGEYRLSRDMAPSSQGKSPPTNPVRFMVRRHANSDTRSSIDNQPLLPRADRRVDRDRRHAAGRPRA